MIRLNLKSNAGIGLGCLAVAMFVADARACSVCFGDPESKMTLGAVWGVATLVGVVVMVLGGIAGTGLFWIQRSRKIASGELIIDDDGVLRESETNAPEFAGEEWESDRDA
ncbi:MAG: hypothetical protein ACPGXK_06750 [Phycisphaerae bacterium]